MTGSVILDVFLLVIGAVCALWGAAYIGSLAWHMAQYAHMRRILRKKAEEDEKEER